MIFKNIPPNELVEVLMKRFKKEHPKLLIRLNSAKPIAGVYRCSIKCSQTKTKVVISVEKDTATVVGFERVKNIPRNITTSLVEVQQESFHATDIESIFVSVKKVLLKKSECILHSEKGNPEKISGVVSLKQLNDTNVFYGIVRNITAFDSNLIIKLSNGDEFTFNSEEVKKIPGINNAVGRYLVRNNFNDTVIMAPNKFDALIKT